MADPSKHEKKIAGLVAISIKTSLLLFILILSVKGQTHNNSSGPGVVYAGGDGPGNGKHIVLVAGSDGSAPETKSPCQPTKCA